MRDVNAFTKDWQALPEIGVLLACAKRCGLRIGIRGGVVRNFMLTDVSPRSLFDLVDPFSDIDCVVDDESHWPELFGSISSSISFSGFHRWEVDTRDSIVQCLDQYAKLPIERLIVWHDGKTKTEEPARIELDGLGEDPESILGSAAAIPEFDIADKYYAVMGPLNYIVDKLRFGRYILQFPNQFKIAARDIVEAGNWQESLSRKLIREKLSPVDRFRFETALLDIIANAENSNDLLEFLLMFSELMPGSLRDQSSVLNIVSDRITSGPSSVGALVYSSGPNSRTTAEVLSRRGGATKRDGIESLIPWTPMWSIGKGFGECCRHQDFQNGVAVLSWRSMSNNKAFIDIQEADYALAAQITGARPYGRGPKDVKRQILPLPGFVRRGPSVTVRMDHAFLSAFLQNDVNFFLGLVRIERE